MAQLGLDFPTKWGRGYSARIVRNLIQGYMLAPFVRYMSSLEVQGLEHLSGPGPFIFAANHTSHLDTPLVLTALPDSQRKRTVVAAAMDNFFMSASKGFPTVLIFNAIPIDRHKINRRSAQLALELVEDKWNLLIYPEGGRTPDGALQDFMGGAAYLAQRANATVIPVYIHGAGEIQGPKFAKAPQYTTAKNNQRHHVVVAFGPGLQADDNENLRHLSGRIEEAVIKLGREVSGDTEFGAPRPSAS